MPTPEIRIGVGGWTFAPWRGTFFPKGVTQKQELAYASRQLTSIEVNGTYYGTIKRDSFRAWRDETPDDFVFSLKAPRFATNRRVLAEAGDSIARFLDSGILELREKLGPINWQFMPTKKFDPDDFAAFLALLPQEAGGRKLRHAVDVRHESFRCPEFVGLAVRHKVAIAVAGDSKFPLIGDATADFVYARIMGTSENEPLGYGKKALDLWANRAAQWAKGQAAEGLSSQLPFKPRKSGRDVFLYVISGHKERNPAAAMALIERLS
jgi:uncharacterized protein YecE (DUF72 family)